MSALREEMPFLLTVVVACRYCDFEASYAVGNSQLAAKAFSGANQTHNVPRSIDEPLGTATTATGGGLFLVEPSLTPFVLGQHGGSVARDLDQPIPTVATDGAISVVEPHAQPYLVEVNHEGERRARSVDDPLPTVTAKNGVGMVEPFVVSYLGNDDGPNRIRSTDEPLSTIVGSNRLGLVEPFLTAHFGEREGQAPRVQSIDAPLPTVTHRGAGDYVEPVAEPLREPAPRERVVEIDGKLYVLDIRFRMLQPFELARAQGFDDGYLFTGNKSETTAMIGNAVPVKVAKALVEAIVPDVFGVSKKREAVA